MSKTIYNKQRFSKQWWINAAHASFWITVVTILVWVFADLEHVGKEDFKAIVTLTSGKANIQLLSKRQIELDFELRGNRKILEQFKRDLNANGGELTYDVSEDFGPGEHFISRADILKRAANIEQLGLTVLSASGTSVRIELDEVLVKTLPVKFAFTNATLAGTAEIEPGKISVQVGLTAWEKIKREQNEPTLVTVQTDLKNVSGGKDVEQKVEIVPMIAGIPVIPEIKYVTVKFKISERTGTEDIKIPILVLAPPAWNEDETWKRYALKRKDITEWLPQITVRGPRKDLDQLRTRKIIAYVKLIDDDKKPVESWLKRQAVIIFPKDLQIEPVGPSPTVEFKLVERLATSPAP